MESTLSNDNEPFAIKKAHSEKLRFAFDLYPFSTPTNNVSHHSEKPRLSVIQQPVALLLGLVLNTETIRISIRL